MIRQLLAVCGALVAVLSIALMARQAPAPGPQAPAGRPAQTPPTSSQRPSFRSGTDVVSLNVTVTDSTGRYVLDIPESEFVVFESGIKQDLTFYSRREHPIALSLLLDSSASMDRKLPTVQAAAVNFVRKLKPTDLAQVIDFDNSVTVRQAFTGNHADLEKGIQEMSPGGPTSLHNAIYIALKELKKVQVVSDEDPRRQAIVLFSDGEDTSSLVSFDEVLDLAKRSETAIYAIGLRDKESQTRGFRNAEYVLRQLAIETGGRAFFPGDLGDLVGVYDQIADELSNQYVLGYTSNNPRRDGAWRQIVVQVSRPNLTSRTKRGYFAPTTPR